jgi:hypothetical protein
MVLMSARLRTPALKMREMEKRKREKKRKKRKTQQFNTEGDDSIELLDN